jgi:hypothetical protein
MIVPLSVQTAAQEIINGEVLRIPRLLSMLGINVKIVDIGFDAERRLLQSLTIKISPSASEDAS